MSSPWNNLSCCFWYFFGGLVYNNKKLMEKCYTTLATILPYTILPFYHILNMIEIFGKVEEWNM